MANATKDLQTPVWGAGSPVEITMGVKAATKIYKGTMVMKDAGTNLAAPAADGANNIVVGIARDTVDNTGGAGGALSIVILRGCYGLNCKATDEPRDPNEIFKDVYVTDDNTVQKTAPANNTVAGKCVKVEPAPPATATRCWVEFLKA
jgi:hypothetical protein